MSPLLALLMASAALSMTAGTVSAQDQADLSPLLDGFVKGCVFGEPLSDLMSSLPDAALSGADLALPQDYKSLAGKPVTEMDADGVQVFHLPLGGQWRGEAVTGLDLARGTDSGMYVAAVRFAGSSDPITAAFAPLVDESQVVLDQQEMATELGHEVALTTDQGITRLLCNLST